MDILYAFTCLVKGIRLSKAYADAISNVDGDGTGPFENVSTWLVSAIANFDSENDKRITESIWSLKTMQMLNDKSISDEEVAKELISILKEWAVKN